MVEAARGRFERDGEAGGVNESERPRDRRPIGQQRQFGRSRAIVGDTEYPVADRDICNAFSDLVDDARHVATRRLRQPRAEAQQAAAQLAIGRIDAGRVHDDPDLSGTGMRVGKIHDLEDLGTSEPAELRCFHELLLEDIIANAVRFTRPSRSRPPKLGVSMRCEGPRWLAKAR